MYPLSEQTKKALRLLHESGYEAYIVGGCVRDYLLGMQPKDIDITTNAEPPQIKSVFAAFQMIGTGLKHGTVTVLIDGTPFEITTYRVDLGYSDGRHPDAVRFTRSLYEDAARRDLTMNALAYNEEEGLIDSFGGAADVRARIIRCVGDPDRRFQEDALRVLRALRFASSLGFSIEPATERALFAHSALLPRISAERVAAELEKLLCGAFVQPVLRRYASVLLPCFPELGSLSQDQVYQTAAICGSVRPYFPLRLAALFCRLAPQAASAGLARLRLSNKTKAYTAALLAHFPDEFSPSRPSVRRLLGALPPPAFFDLTSLKRADGEARGDAEALERIRAAEQCAQRALADGDCCSLAALAVNGADLKERGVRGAALGALLRSLLDAVIENRVPNEREALLRCAEELQTEKIPDAEPPL